MKRRHFLSVSAAAFAGGACVPVHSADGPSDAGLEEIHARLDAAAGFALNHVDQELAPR